MALGVDMNRSEWKAFHHAIRADARAFKAKHGGGPCFGRTFTHNGVEYLLRRAWYSPGKWMTDLRAAAIIDRPPSNRHACALSWAGDFRREAKRTPWDKYRSRRAWQVSIDDCRAIRIGV